MWGGRQLSIIEQEQGQEEQVPESFDATPGGADASTLASCCNGMFSGTRKPGMLKQEAKWWNFEGVGEVRTTCADNVAFTTVSTF